MTDKAGPQPLGSKPPKNGRKAFKGLAPEGFRIRVMEPGEAQRLLEIQTAAAPDVSIDLAAFTQFLVSHDVFVAAVKADDRLAGFAAANAEADLYWLSTLAVDPAHAGQGIGSALLSAVTKRAQWFFYRAVGLSTTGSPSGPVTFYEKRGFLQVPTTDLPQWLDERRRADPLEAGQGDRRLMLRWL